MKNNIKKLEASLVSKIPIAILVSAIKEFVSLKGKINIVDLLTVFNLWLEDTLRLTYYLIASGELIFRDKIITIKNENKDHDLAILKDNPWLIKWNLDIESKIDLNGEEKNIMKVFKDSLMGRPSNNDKIDQYYSTPETNIKRLRLVVKENPQFKRRICFFGDDDLTSIMFAISKSFSKIVVFDIDKRIIDHINNTMKRLGIKNCVAILHDYRDIFPKKNNFDIFHSDPPATNEAIELVLKRAKQLSDPGAVFYLSWPEFISDPEYLLQIESTYIKNGWLLMEKYQDFNEYDNECLFNYLSKEDWDILRKLNIDKEYILKRPPMQRYCLTKLILSQKTEENIGRYDKEIYLSNLHKIPS